MSVRSKKVAESEFDVPSIDDSTLWPEWSDVVLNKENWGIPKNGPDGLFLDKQSVQLPPSLVPHEWIRAKDLQNVTEPLTVFVDDSGYSDLITKNKHLLHSQFARWFISALINLEHCGKDGLEISGENGNFIWNGRYQSWRGWMNVYSMNKAGKGAQHQAVVNPNGKYIVRLYFLGCWRRIVVDDMIPVNVEGLPLLPRTANDFELWPMLLSKALLKVCSLTWTPPREIVDFHPVTCLTGWVCLRLDVAYLSPQDKWDFLRRYADHFEWETETMEEESQEATRSKINSEGKKSKDTVRTKRSKDTGRSKRSKDTDVSKKSKRTDRTKKSKDTARSKRSKDVQRLKALNSPQPVTLFLGLEDMREVSSKDVPGLSPCWGHFVYVAQSRDIPLDPKDVKPPLARWKLYRWLRWAISEGLIDPVEYFVPIRSLKVVSPLKKCEHSVINKYNDTNVENNLQNEDTNQRSTTDKTDPSEHPQKESSTEEQSGDISFWADFNKMEPYIKDIHFFYKLDYFKYTAKLSDRFVSKQSNDQRSETRKGSKKGSRKSSPSRATFKDPEFIDAYNWPKKMSKSRNEPLYVFTDSLEEKFFLVDFSTFQISANSSEENDDRTNSTPKTANTDYLIVERHNWFRRPEKFNRLISIMTSGTNSIVMELEPGRHLLRMYCRSDSHCFVTISSDTIFHLGDRRKMYQLMSTESERIDHLAKRISNYVSNAYQSFGTERYQEALKQYYRSYLPPIQDLVHENKLFYDQIHDFFVEEEVQLIRRIMPEDEVPAVLRSLRIFFLNPAIGLERSDTISRLIQNLQGSSTIENSTKNVQSEKRTLDQDRAAFIIQASFKMLIVKRYRSMHDPKHEEHQKVLGNLLKVAQLFDYNRRESLANQLLRNILKHHDKLYDIYPFYKDFEYTIQVQEVKGIVTNVKQNQWLPIARLVVNSQPTETVFACIDMFIGLPKYSVRVFNNETGREMLRVVNNVVSIHYQHLKLGYTIFCHGWSEEREFKELPWTMSVITMKEQPVFYSLDNEAPLSTATVPPTLMVEELSNTYVPNSRECISKWIVRVAKPSIVSLRLRTSYENVRMRFRVTDEEQNVLAQVKGKSVVILPVVYLGLQRDASDVQIKIGNNDENGKLANGHDQEEGSMEEENESRSRESMDHRVYHVEALVLDESWPLTKSEWIVVTKVRENIMGSPTRMKLASVSHMGKLSKSELLKAKKGSKQSVDSQALEPPYWVLRVVTDVGSGVEVSQDRTKEKEIVRMKEAWAKENPDSLARGRELREAFVKKHEIKIESSAVSLRRKSSITAERASSKGHHRTSIVDCSEISMPSFEPRTSKLPPSLRRLPLLDLTTYEVKEDEEDIPWIKTELDEETLRSSRVMNIIYAREDYMHFLEEMNAMMKAQKQKYKTLFGKHKDSFWERRDLLEVAYEMRKAYISSTKPAPAPGSKKSSSRKSKKSKKA